MCNCKDYSLQDAIDELYSKFNVLKELNEYNNKGYMTHFPFMECETIINGYVMSVEEIRVQILVAPTLLKTKKNKIMKLLRILILCILFVILYIIGLTIIPLITWLFGGPFLEVIQHPVYILFTSFFLCFGIGCLFHETVNGDNYTFKR
jgi:uncharacterized membrane protein YqjE